MEHIVLLLGSNLGNKIDNIEQAIVEIEKYIGKISKKTKIIKTDPWGFYSTNNFKNCVVEVITEFSPVRLLKMIKNIELKFGRIKLQNKFYEDRIIDIDIIYYRDVRFWNKNLVIPHYLHINERKFSKKLLEELKKIKN